MSAIPATSVKCNTMADDTLRITIDIDPRYAEEAFQLFGKRGIPMGIARLTKEAAIQSAQAETISDHIAIAGKMVQTGGALAKLAGMFCGRPEFSDWIESRIKYWPAGLEQKYKDLMVTGDEDYGRIFIISVCGISSRVELDHNEQAAIIFHEQIRKPYAEYLRTVA